MRCSSCEPVLDQYVEGTLTPRRMLDIGKHLEGCANCRALFDELKVVDALLFTTQVPDLPENFSFAVMAEVNAMPAPRPRSHPVWSFLALYSAAAWVAAIAGLAISGTSPKTIFTLLANAFANAGSFSNAIAAGLSHTLAHSMPALAAFGFGVLLIDFAIAVAFALLYFVVRPRLAARLATVPEATS